MSDGGDEQDKRETRGDGDALQTKMSLSPKCISFPPQATTATHILMGAYENIVRFSNKISTFS